MQELEGGTSYIGEVDDSDMKVKLKQKEQHIQTLQTQVESLQQHSNCQSRQILQLKQELEALKVRDLTYTDRMFVYTYLCYIHTFAATV